MMGTDSFLWICDPDPDPSFVTRSLADHDPDLSFLPAPYRDPDPDPIADL